MHKIILPVFQQYQPICLQHNIQEEILLKILRWQVWLPAFCQIPTYLFPAPFCRAKNRNNLFFLFQGDSITDGNRGRNNDPNHILGHGYVFSIASRAGAHFPGRGNSFYNRGISGNTITDLAQRWKTDTIDLKPDVLSIMVGVNDTDAALKQQGMVSIEKYEEAYRLLLTQTLQALPDCLLVLCEPFILPVGRVKDNWIIWNTDMQKRRETVRRLAGEFDTVFVPLQKVFDDAAQLASADYWIWDGIHPTYSGHELITREWLKQVRKKLPFLKDIHF